MKFDVWAQTDVGLKRDINQDAILVDHDLNLFVLADGMGGHRGGEVASALAVESVQEVIAKRHSDTRLTARKIIGEAYREASAKIHRKSTMESPELMGMGTTMVLFWECRGKFYLANVGDSRAYLYSGGHLWQLTEDHSLINEQVRAGVISEEEAPHVIGRNVITRSVGFERDVLADVLERDYSSSDEYYLLCSDGLSSLVSAEKIMTLFKRNGPQEVVSKCIVEAKSAGGDDNISVILIHPRQDS